MMAFGVSGKLFRLYKRVYTGRNTTYQVSPGVYQSSLMPLSRKFDTAPGVYLITYLEQASIVMNFSVI